MADLGGTRDAREGQPERVVGSYVLKRRLGSGAMGEVWLGWHRHTESSAAVKLLKDNPSFRGRSRRFFDRERRAIARLSHPNVISLYEVGPEHIAMAYVDGPNLAERVMNGIEPSLAISYTLQIASALSHAHDLGIVHRDVKPGTESMLMSAREGSPSSTVMASTLMASSDGSGDPSAPPPRPALDAPGPV